MADIRDHLREQFESETGKDVDTNLAEYADWLELRIMRDFKEKSIEVLRMSLIRISSESELASLLLKELFKIVKIK